MYFSIFVREMQIITFFFNSWQGQAVDGDLGLVIEQKGERLVGKHVRPKLGMLVTMSAQGLERRKEAGRADPSRGGGGTIVRVNENWTVGEFTHPLKLLEIQMLTEYLHQLMCMFLKRFMCKYRSTKAGFSVRIKGCFSFFEPFHELQICRTCRTIEITQV